MSKNIPFKINFTAVDKISGVIDKIQAKFPQLTRTVSRSMTAFDLLQQKTKKIRANLDSMGDTFTNVGAKMTAGITAPVAGIAALSVKTFADLEEGLIGVGKTTGLSGDNLKQFDRDLMGLSKRMPIATESLFDIAQIGGQLGIKTAPELLKFSETIAKVGKATDLEGEAAAKTLLEILTITREGVGGIDQFASAIVALGNDFGVTESMIASMASETARGISLWGGTSAQAAGLGTAMARFGVNAEAGGTVIADAFIKINDSITEGGDKLSALSKITGIAGKDMRQAFNQDSVGVFQKFLKGIGQLPNEKIIEVLEGFGLSGARVAKTLPVLAKNSDFVTRAISASTDAFKKNTALDTEFAQFAKSFNSQMTVLKNNFTDMMKVLGTHLAPFVLKFAEALGGLMKFFERHPTIATFVAVLAGLAATIGPLLLILGQFAFAISNLITVGSAVIAVMAGWKVAIAATLVPMLPLIATVGLLTTAGVLLWKNWEPIKQFFTELWDEPMLKLQQFIDMFSKLGVLGAIKELAGFGSDVSTEFASVGGGAPLVPRGTALDTKPVTEKINESFNTRTNNASVQVDFKNMPAGVRVLSQSENDALKINNGFAGAF